MSDANHSNSSFDAWDTELFDGGVKTMAKDIQKASTNILNIKTKASSVLTSIKTAFTPPPAPAKPIPSPIAYQSQLPAIRPTKALVPVVGIALAVLTIWGGQKLSPLVREVSLAPDNFSIGVFSSLVVEPAGFIFDKVATLPNTLIVGADQVASVGLFDWLDKPVTATYQEQSQSSFGQNTQMAGVVTSIGETMKNLWMSIVDFFSFYKDLVFNNWLAFLFGEEEKTLDNNALRAQIKAEVLAELRAEMDQNIPSDNAKPVVTTTATGQGLVVMPVTEGQTPTEVAQKIGGLFSDPVTVRFDASGQAGIITPEFKNPQDSSDYVFVLTPIKK
jgi:hypothetical protein